MTSHSAPPQPPLDLAEHGRSRDGATLSLDRRLFMQLNVFTGCDVVAPVADALRESGIGHVLYRSIHDPFGIGVLTHAEDPGQWIDLVHPVFRGAAFSELRPLPDYTMLGRTYSLGYESDLEETLFARPLARVQDRALLWAVWYPLRRKPAFERLPAEARREALMEHGGIGRRFGAAGEAYDIRLACHGLDPKNNDFVVGLVGPRLYPLSALVQTMRTTVQTAEYVEGMGPFFVGRVVQAGKGS